MFKFKNKAFISLYLLLLAQLFNDWWSTSFGFPTPVQLVLIVSIVILPWPKNREKEYRFLRNCLFGYLLFVIVSFYLVFNINENKFAILSIAINTIYLLRLIQNFKKNNVYAIDIEKFFKLILISIFLITIPAGLIELITHNNIIRTDKGLAVGLFYLRGLHIDKVDFGSYLSLGSFVGLGMLLTKKIKTWLKMLGLVVVLLSLLLVSLSFSTTSIVGLTFGILVIFALSPGKSKTQYVFILLITFVLFSSLIKTNLANKQMEAYKLKYKLQVEDYKLKNGRYVMFISALNIFSESPLIGHGFERSAYVFQEKLNLEKPLNSHNIIANELVNNGLIGFVPLALFFINIFVISYKALRINQEKMDIKILNFSFICTGFGVFILFRLMLYYHQFDNTIYLIWAATSFLLYKYYKNYSKNTGIYQKKTVCLHNQK